MLKTQTLRVLNGLFLLVRNLALAAGALGIGLAVGLALVNGNYMPLTLVGVAIYTLIIFINPLAGLLLWIVTAPFSRFVHFDIILGRGVPDLTLTRTCAGLLMVAVLARLAAGRMRLPRPILLDVAVLLSLMGIGASLPASYEGLRHAVTSFADTYLVPAVIYFLARLLVRERRHAEHVCTALIVMGVILATVAIHEQLTGRVLFLYSERSWYYGNEQIRRLAGLLGSPAFFATLMVMASGFTVYRFARAAGRDERLLYGVLAAYLVFGVYNTFNRAGWLSLAINLTILAVFLPGFRRVFAVVVLAAVVGLALSWGTVQSSPIVTRRLSARGPIDYRMEILSRAPLILGRSPLLGLGYGNFGYVYLRYSPAWERGVVLPAPHNSFLEVSFNSGLFGVVPYVAMFLLMGAGIRRFYQRAGRAQAAADAALILAFGLAIVAYLVQAMIVDMISGHYVNMVMMLVAGSVFGWQIEEENAGRHSGTIPDGPDQTGRS